MESKKDGIDIIIVSVVQLGYSNKACAVDINTNDGIRDIVSVTEYVKIQ